MNEQLSKALALHDLWKQGKLGGEKMPEDSNPGLPLGSEANCLYFTMPMALNYQRNSYKLWEAAKQTFQNKETQDVFQPHAVTSMAEHELRQRLLKYKLALQPNRHIEIWKTICGSIVSLLGGEIRNLFVSNNNDVREIKRFVQKEHKKHFPYLSGEKICNYWLYVLGQYTDIKLTHREAITIAPDTHVVQASIRLGLIKGDEANTQQATVAAWEKLLEGSGLLPIDMHTPLWLWSRGGFRSLNSED